MKFFMNNLIPQQQNHAQPEGTDRTEITITKVEVA